MNNRSLGYQKYLKKIKKEKIMVCLIRIFILVSFIFLWEIASRRQWINTFITSSPYNIIRTISSLLTDSALFFHLRITLTEVFVGFICGMILGIMISVLFWLSPIFSKILDPYIVILNALPKVALGPLIIIWAGAGSKAIIIMTLSISLITTIITIYGGFAQTDENKITLLRSFGANKYMILKNVIFPDNINTMINCLKINIGLTWVGAIMGEFLVSKAGIGYLIMYGSQVFNLNLVMSGIILLCLCASLTYFGVVIIEKIICIKY